MVRSKIGLIAVVLATALLPGCAAISAGAGGVVDRVKAPAIVAIEATVAGSFEQAIDSLTAGESNVSSDEATAIAEKAQVTMSRLAIARIAYDATIGGDASEAVQRQIADARATTDATFARLMGILIGRLGGAAPAPT